MVRPLSRRGARWCGRLRRSRAEDDALAAMEPAHRGRDRGARLPAPVSARNVRKRRACAGSIVDCGAVTQDRRWPAGRARVTGAALMLLVLAGSRASAQTAPPAERVIVLQPSAASPAARRSLARIRDELSADRYVVIVADASTAGDPDAVLEGAAARLGDAGTVLVLFGDPESGQAELCVVRRTARRTAVRRATVAVDDPDRIPELLAKRALELLRATALELSLEVEPAPRAEKPAAPRSRPEIPSSSMPPPAPAPDAALVVVDMGIGMWNSLEGPPAALAPVGRVGLRLSKWAWARVSVVGFGSRPRVDTAYGSASLAQTMALLE